MCIKRILILAALTMSICSPAHAEILPYMMDPTFERALWAIIDDLKNFIDCDSGKDNEISEIMKELLRPRSDPKSHTVFIRDGDFSPVFNMTKWPKVKAAEDGTGVSSVIQWHTKGPIPTFYCEKCLNNFDLAATLLHELVHAYDAHKGKMSPQYESDGLKRVTGPRGIIKVEGCPNNEPFCVIERTSDKERHAVEVENRYRRMKGLCMRNRYGCTVNVGGKFEPPPCKCPNNFVCLGTNDCSDCLGGNHCIDPKELAGQSSTGKSSICSDQAGKMCSDRGLFCDREHCMCPCGKKACETVNPKDPAICVPVTDQYCPQGYIWGP